VCGHSDAEVIADRDDVLTEVEALWEYHEKRLRPGTPPPRLMDRLAFSERPPIRLVRCNECRTVYRNPVERQRELIEIYTQNAPGPDILRSLHQTQLPALRQQARALHQVLGRGGSGLEVGSYAGAFLAAAREEGFAFEGLDINTKVNAFTRSLGFTVHDGELTDFSPKRTYDVIAIWNTFDQLADPRGAAHAAAKLLAPGGVVVIRVPNGGVYARMRRRWKRGGRTGRIARAILAQNNLLTFPYRWGFTPPSLVRLLEEAGLSVKAVRGDVLVPIADEWTKPWARLEEATIKRALVMAARNDVRRAPWFEVYAVRATERADTNDEPVLIQAGEQ
jgi:SAM-dependent methyltransferase